MNTVTDPVEFPETFNTTSPLYKCLQAAAQLNGVHEHHVAFIMAAFLNELINQVSHNRAVTIPGFGQFGALPLKSRVGGAPYCIPAFTGHPAFKSLVELGCPASFAAELMAVRNYRKRNHRSATQNTRSGQRPVMNASAPDTIMNRYARSIEKRAREGGLVDEYGN